MKRFLFIVLSAVLLLAGCTVNQGGNGAKPSGSDNGGTGVKPVAYMGSLKQQTVAALDKNFVGGVNSFGFNVAQKLYSKDKNLAVSPVSMELVLAMTRAGAAGDTAQQMKDTLGLSALSDADIITACKSLMWRANTGGMEAANSIWMYDSYPFNQSFIDTCTGDFMADAMPLVIPGAMNDINTWASDKTHGKIDKIIPQELDASTRLVLVNALYFLGDWELPFDANDTYDGDFNSPDGSVKASYMNSEWSVPYYENNDFSMISLSFKSGEGEGKYAMAFLLPAQGKSVSDMLSSLSGDGFSSALSAMSDERVTIKLPKFDFAFGASLNDTLQTLGMRDAFDPSAADFSGMTSQEASDLYIANVLHKCYVRIDELGAEAAAVTSVEMRLTAVMPMESKQFIADRPFAFAIYSQEDGTIAFLGVVNNPTQK